MSRSAKKRAELTERALAHPPIAQLVGVLTMLGFGMGPVRLAKTLRRGPMRVTLVFHQPGPNGAALLRYHRTVDFDA